MKAHLVGAALLCVASSTVSAQLLRLTDLNTTQIESLDRSRTVILMPGGVLEQHGPYLPAFTDGFMNEWWTERLGETLAREGYGSPIHNLTLDQAGDYFRDTYGGQMVNLTGLEAPKSPSAPSLGEEAARVNGMDIHAGLSESSRILFLKPQLVSPGIAQARPYTARSPEELVEIARRDGWPGYFGAPHLATAAYGAKVMHHRLSVYTGLALEILGGKDPRSIPRYATEAMKREKAVMDDSLAYDASVRRKQDAWMKKNGVE